MSLEYPSIAKLVVPLIETYTPFQPKPVQTPDGTWTYGFGFARDLAGKTVTAKTLPMSLSIATILRDKAIASLFIAIAAKVVVPLSEGQFAALVDYAYDVGIEKLSAGNVFQAINLGSLDKARDSIARDVYIKKNNRMMISKPREQRRKVDVTLWEKSDAAS